MVLGKTFQALESNGRFAAAGTRGGPTCSATVPARDWNGNIRPDAEAAEAGQNKLVRRRLSALAAPLQSSIRNRSYFGWSGRPAILRGCLNIVSVGMLYTSSLAAGGLAEDAPRNPSRTPSRRVWVLTHLTPRRRSPSY
jgi:hypothetical protein